MIDFNERGYVDGYLERKSGGRFDGIIKIDGVDLSPIEGMYFKDANGTHLLLKRKPVLQYDPQSQTYKPKIREPRWEAYLHKGSSDTVDYRGEFKFLRFRYSIVGFWDKVFGTTNKRRMNFYIERLPREKQTIINSINQRNKELYNKKN